MRINTLAIIVSALVGVERVAAEGPEEAVVMVDAVEEAEEIAENTPGVHESVNDEIVVNENASVVDAPEVHVEQVVPGLVIVVPTEPIFHAGNVAAPAVAREEGRILPSDISDKSILTLAVLADTGYANDELRATTSMVHTKFGDRLDAVLMLGDNFYPRGIDFELGIADPMFTENFEDIVAKNIPDVNFYVIMGNHDWQGNVQAQLEYGQVNPRWIMPSLYYMKRWSNLADNGERFDTCVWFLDQDHMNMHKKSPRFTEVQAQWLDNSLETESAGCAWRIVSGHFPIFDIGEYSDNKHLLKTLLPLLNKHKVHLYMSGHEHQSQVMYNKDVSETVFVVAGQTCEYRCKTVKKTHPMFVWNEPWKIAFFALEVSLTELKYAFHGSMYPSTHAPLYEGVIKREESIVDEAEFNTPKL